MMLGYVWFRKDDILLTSFPKLILSSRVFVWGQWLIGTRVRLSNVCPLIAFCLGEWSRTSVLNWLTLNQASKYFSTRSALCTSSVDECVSQAKKMGMAGGSM